MIGIYMVMTMIMTCSWPKLKGSRSGKEDDYDCCWPRLRGLRSGDYDPHYGGYHNQDDQDD